MNTLPLIFPPSSMSEIEFILAPDSLSDRGVVIWAARRLDRQLQRRYPVTRWIDWLWIIRRESVDDSRLAHANPSIVRAICRYGAEQLVAQPELLLADERENLDLLMELHRLLLDPLALELLLAVKECPDPKLRHSLDLALQAADCLHVREGSGTITRLASDPTPALLRGEEHGACRRPTNLAVTDNPADRCEIQSRLRNALFDMLQTIGVEMPSASESVMATQLLSALAGREAISEFRALVRWVEGIRSGEDHDGSGEDHDGSGEDHDVRVIRSLLPELFERDYFGGYRQSVSYRLWLRRRLLEFCERHLCDAEHWEELEHRQRQLRLAARGLSRDRIGFLLQSALAGAWRAGDESWLANELLERAGASTASLADSLELLRKGD